MLAIDLAESVADFHHGLLGFAGERTAARAEFNHVRWISHCRGMVQLPAAA